MAATSVDTDPATPLTARKTWRTVEPLHGMIYFAPEADRSYAALGLPAGHGYFASRAAPMGAVSADTVIATFFNFCPDLVRAAIPSAWAICPPARVLEARVEAADAALSRMLGEAIDSPDMARAATLARRAAERACEHPEGRPLFAGHAGLAWPEPPHLVLWHAQTLLREFRGDGHVAALVLHDLDPVEALVFHLATGELPGPFLRDSRGWPDHAWAEGIARLEARGLITATDPDAPTADGLALTATGAAVRQELEDQTDRLAVGPYRALGEDGCAELRRLVRPFSVAVVEGAGFGPAATT
jgi:hypothetical protein